MNEDRNTDTAADLESNARHESLAAEEVTRPDPPYHVHVHTVCKRLGDVDGRSAKAMLDGLVKSGIFPDDSPQWIKSISYSQEKGSDEKTIITIEAASDT